MLGFKLDFWDYVTFGALFQIASQHELIKLRYEQLANLITLHLALGGGFD